MKSFKLATAIALGSASGALIGYSALAGGDKVAFPEGYEKGTLYAVVDRYDNKQYRELWSTPAAVDAVRKGQPIPSGTVLTLVQYKAQLDAAGNPTKDANGRFQKGDLVAYTSWKSVTAGAPNTRTMSATANGSTRRSGRTRRSTTRPTSRPASPATSRMPGRIS